MKTNLSTGSVPLDQLIMVEKPYNILKDLIRNEDGSVEATLINEYLPEEEAGPIGCAEFGRHIAILGSIVLSNTFNHKEKHYYLAMHADLERKHSHVYKSDELNLIAKTIIKEKRGGKVYGEISNQAGEIIYSATLDYQVISQAVFSRLYAKHKKEVVIKNEISTPLSVTSKATKE